MSFKINLDEYNQKINKANKYEIKKIIIASAGPIANILLAIIFYKLKIFPYINQTIVYANIIIAIFNLLPIYPLDGGRIIKGILHIYFGKWKAKKYINDISIIFVIIITAVASIGVYYFKNVAFLAIVVYLWYIVIKENTTYKKQIKLYKIIKTIENN